MSFMEVNQSIIAACISIGGWFIKNCLYNESKVERDSSADDFSDSLLVTCGVSVLTLAIASLLVLRKTYESTTRSDVEILAVKPLGSNGKVDKTLSQVESARKKKFELLKQKREEEKRKRKEELKQEEKEAVEAIQRIQDQQNNLAKQQKRDESQDAASLSSSSSEGVQSKSIKKSDKSCKHKRRDKKNLESKGENLGKVKAEKIKEPVEALEQQVFEIVQSKLFVKWLDKQNPKVQKDVEKRLERIEKLSDFGEHKSLHHGRTSTFELKFRNAVGTRIYYVPRGNKIHLLCGGDKSDQQKITQERLWILVDELNEKEE